MQAIIQVDTNAHRGRINPHIYGQMFENAGNCVYDGLWVGEDSAIANENGIRTDILEKLHEVQTSIIRWPGGTPSETYHWREGVGPPADRSHSLLAGTCWNSPGESNAFGTDEYITLCRQLNCDPYICVNVGTGTAQEAANWVEYCNHDGDTPFAALRKANGHDKPFAVKYWGIGNESYFWYDKPDDYATLLHQYVKAMRLVDPTIKIVAAGKLVVDPPDNPVRAVWEDKGDWNRTVLQRVAQDIDYISLHPYWGIDNDQGQRGIKGYDDFVACPYRVEKAVCQLDTLIQEVTGDSRIRIALDEWQVWHPGQGSPANRGEQTCTLQDAIYAAGFFHMLHRQHSRVAMANLCNLVNCLPAIVTDGPRMYLNPIYHAVHLYAAHSGPIALESQVQVPTYEATLAAEVPYLDCSATFNDKTGQLNIAIINRHPDTAIDCHIKITGGRPQGPGRVFEISGESKLAANDFDHSDPVVITQRPLDNTGEQIQYTCPAHSCTVLEIEMGAGERPNH
jgi:alpha-N-arabinofuranosidase